MRTSIALVYVSKLLGSASELCLELEDIYLL
jgi:hypothetical protein